MKRTFLKVALLSTALLSMPVAFTSCKDYQDDIDNQGKEISELQEQVKKLQEALEQAKADCVAASNEAKAAAAAAKAEAIEEAIAQCKALMAEGYASKEQVADLATKISAIETGLNTLTAQVNDAQAAITQLQIQIKALENFGKTTGYETVEAAIADLQGKISAIQSKMDSLATSENVEAAKQELKLYCDQAIAAASAQVSKISSDLVTLLTTQLRSLVFIPNLYVDGIEATSYTYLTYYAKTMGKQPVTQANQNGVACTVGVVNKPFAQNTEGWSYTTATGLTEIDPVNYVNYQLNPASAVVTEADLDFLANDVAYLNTRATVNPLVAPGKTTTANGDLTVGYTCKGSAILTGDKVSNFALQAKVPNMEVDGQATQVGHVTSDYAILIGDNYYLSALAFNQTTIPGVACALNTNELYPTIEQAIAKPASINIYWDSTYDLTKVIETHYNHPGVTGSEGRWNTPTIESYGLHYDYAPIQYVVGTNETSDTRFIQQAPAAQGLITPCGVNLEDGMSDNIATKAAKDKQPIVRVRLMDGTNTVLVGFVKFNITEEVKPVEPAEPVVTGNNEFGPIQFACAGAQNNITWYWMTNQVYQRLNMSKEEFENTYDPVKSGSNYAQFKKNADGTFTSLPVASYIGTITEAYNPTGATTNVFTWTLGVTDLQAIYEAGTPYTVYVCYAPKSGDVTVPSVYIPLVVTSVVKPEGTIGNKAASAWFRGGEVNLLNVPQPSWLNGAPTVMDYNTNLNLAWYYNNGGVQVSAPKLMSITNGNAASYTGLKYYLTAQNNSTEVKDVVLNGTTIASVKLSVENATAQSLLGGIHNVPVSQWGKHGLVVSGAANEFSNTTLYATANGVKTPVAVLNQTSGIIEYQNNDLAKALLNHYASGPKNNADRPDAQLPVYIGICVWDPACDLALPLTNGTYAAYFLRPINVASAEGKWFQDAANNGSTISIASLLNFSDWRFFDFTGMNAWYFWYYGVESVDIDTANILSDFAVPGTYAVNPKVNAAFKVTDQNTITYPVGPYDTPAINNQILNLVDQNLGNITWDNQELTVTSFNVQIPATVNYAWGSIEVTINAQVKHTYTKK